MSYEVTDAVELGTVKPFYVSRSPRGRSGHVTFPISFYGWSVGTLWYRTVSHVVMSMEWDGLWWKVIFHFIRNSISFRNGPKLRGTDERDSKRTDRFRVTFQSETHQKGARLLYDGKQSRVESYPVQPVGRHFNRRKAFPTRNGTESGKSFKLVWE